MRRTGAAALLLAAALGSGPAAAQSPAESADLAVGAEQYRMFCASCHGASGDGKGVAAGGLNPAPRDFTAGDFKFGGTDRDLFEVISDGAAPKGGSPLMVSWSPVIGERERWALVRFIRSLKK